MLGVMTVAEASTEVIHIGTRVMINHPKVDVFIDNTFNFATLAEAYRIAALEILAKRSKLET